MTRRPARVKQRVKQRAQSSTGVTTRGAAALRRRLAAVVPRRPDELHRFVSKVLGLHIPRRSMLPGHAAPFDYLQHAFFEGRGSLVSSSDSSRSDAVVWANRGGGKTMLGALATLLDLLFKPGIQVRILGGSFEQSTRMFSHLRRLLDRPALQPMLAEEPTQRRVVLLTQSSAEVLSQSQRSVRGLRVHKLRCDEVEEFDPEVWDAAQMVTRSHTCGDIAVNGAIEALSTMHRPFGLMTRIVHKAQDARTPVFRWSAFDVIERCPPERECQPCPLWDDCQGRAKLADGYIRIDDLIAQKLRSSDETWQSEMLCLQPRRSECVYPMFSVQRHVRSTGYEGKGQWVAGMDFGLRSPLVMVLARLEPGNEPAADRVLHVVDVYHARGLTIDEHLNAVQRRRWPGFAWVGVDPAGAQRNSQTGKTDIAVLQARGWTVRHRRSAIRDGVERIRRRLDRGTLCIDPRCTELIQSLTLYHFDLEHPQRDLPVKDGPDHACDALRYLVVNLECGEQGVVVRGY